MELLRDTVRSYLARRPDASWGEFANALGVAGLAVPEEYGGGGCGSPEVAVVAAELGRALSPQPFLQTAVLAVQALVLDGTEAARDRLLPALAEGAVSATLVFAGSFPDESPDEPAHDGGLRLEDGRLSGCADHVLAGELVLVYVSGLLVEAVPTGRTSYTTLDAGRPLERLRFDRVPVRVTGGAAHMARVRDAGIRALAAEQYGGAARCLEEAVGHAKRRRQFGRPIGAFQAIKHKLADVLLMVESAGSAAFAQTCSAEDAAVAGAYCSQAYLSAAGENIQVHGGIGITWEHDAHRYFKRATSDARLFRTPESHRRFLASRIFEPTSP
ncbi:acyl-CoA dehydrogenase family protein [Nonomuraea longicatena]|uniref:Acyl-CoA dehydrogenase family protein n=1 Tax=Nonomuraea longicatena TaxID=83682 RepID=A0ABN1QPK7_9ACTN